MSSSSLPAGEVRRLAPGETFTFHCRPNLPCYTYCCHDLELALTPYDALRLRRRLGISSKEFLDRHVIIEEEFGGLPLCYLTMVDDGEASCVFLAAEGCTVYPDRPGACRTYPLGRAACRKGTEGTLEVYHVLLTEPHCQGFDADERHDAASYSAAQGLAEYNRTSDLLTTIIQHEQLHSGVTLSSAQAQLYLETLYDIDAFLQRLADQEADSPLAREAHQAAAAGDDAKVLECAVRWLLPRLFPAGENGA